MYSSGEWSSAPTGPRPSRVGSPAPAVQQPSETPPVEVSGTAEPSASPRAAACAASAATAAVRSSGGVTSRSSRRERHAAMRIDAQQLALGPVEVGLVPAAHVDRGARLARDRIEHVAALHARDVQRQALARPVERGDARELSGEREHRVAPVLRLGSGVGRAPAGDDVEPAAALARRHDRPPGRPHSMHRTASKPASRAWVAMGSERTSSSGTHTSSSRAKGRSPPARTRAACAATASPPFMSATPGPISRSPSLRRGRRATVPSGKTVSWWQSSATRARPGALQRGVHVQAGGRGHELAGQPVARERLRDLGGERIELAPARRSAIRARPSGRGRRAGARDRGDGVAHVPRGGDRVSHAASSEALSEPLDASRRPVDRERAPDDLGAVDHAPAARVLGELAVVAEHQVLVGAQVARAEIACRTAALTGRRRRVRLLQEPAAGRFGRREPTASAPSSRRCRPCRRTTRPTRSAGRSGA